ncbi:ABC transporter permease subunit [Actinophytocola xanthii]|uniref:ABC transporter permease n=1 Tax=Actinophytocola xanthii TaxID=1912961 RepID=A0A1Q8BUA4_9PSEU|nr:ABC transporter permease subunit [Actinophytocola xanthii]OLF05660.1 ABC transporter permease [Actinophytocola xanthii]
MIWLTWRQFRIPAITLFALVVAFAVLLAMTGPGIAAEYADGIAACAQQGTDCGPFVNNFLNDYQTASLGVSAVALVMPALIGLFWGAPLVSRELEVGTHRLVWNQSITRTRWLVVKMTITGLAAVVVGAVGAVAVTWWASTIDNVPDNEFNRLASWVFDGRGVVPIGYSAFAFALGVTVGMLLRRALPAMAVTLAVFVVVQFAMPLLVRPYLLPPTDATVEITESTVDTFGHNMQNGRSTVLVEGQAPEEGAWLLSARTVDSSGNPVEAITLPESSTACTPGQSATPEPGAGMKTCLAELTRLGYRHELTYHPASRFWPFQWIETGIYLALSLALAGFCFWWLRHRLA